MRKQLFVFVMALMLAAFGAAFAQTSNPALPPSQQVDQSGQPETGTGIDVDVDAGRNAEDGLVDVDVNSTTDSDTAAEGNDTTGTMATGTALQNEPEEGMDVDVDTGARAEGAVDVDVSSTSDADTDASGIDEGGSLGDEDVAATESTTTTGAAGDMDSDLPATASELPTVALLGLLAMAAAFAVRFLRA